MANDALRPLERVRALLGERVARTALINGGEESQRRSTVEIVPWRQVATWLAQQPAG